MTGLDTALIDACFEAMCSDVKIDSAFSNAIKMMALPKNTTHDRMEQVRQLSAKLVEMPRPEKRLALMKIMRKLLTEDKEAKK